MPGGGSGSRAPPAAASASAAPPQRPRADDVPRAIVAKAEELGAAVLVMPEPRLTLWESLFMQTPVAQQVAARCKRPTVLIR